MSYFIIFLGGRTFGVLTKLDLMDKGTNAVDVCDFSIVLNSSTMDIALNISHLHGILGTRREAVSPTASLGGNCQPLAS